MIATKFFGNLARAASHSSTRTAAARDVAPSPAQIAALDTLSQPTLNVPAPFLKAAGMFMHAGATVNGEPWMVWPVAPKSDAERY